MKMVEYPVNIDKTNTYVPDMRKQILPIFKLIYLPFID